MSCDSRHLLSFCWFLSSASSSSTTFSFISLREIVKKYCWRDIERNWRKNRDIRKSVFHQSLPNMLRHKGKQFWIQDHNSSTICSLTSEGSKSYKMPKGREAPPKPEELIEKLSERLDVVKTRSKKCSSIFTKIRIFCILPHPRGLRFFFGNTNLKE